MLLITGATGPVGRALIDKLLAAGVPVRATSRQPSAARLPDGVEVVKADLGDPHSLTAALDGVHKVFLISSGPRIAEYDATVAKAAASAGVSHIVKLSSGRAGDPAATDPIPHWHRAGELAVMDSGVDWTFLRPLGFMSNAVMWAGSVRGQDAVFAPYGDGRVAVIDPHDIAAVAATVLTTDGHKGQTYTLTGPVALSPGEQVRILGEVLGRPLRYVEVAPDIARQAIIGHGVQPEMADAIMALRATALEGFTSVVYPDVEQVTGTPPRTFRQWAELNRQVFA